MNFDSFSHGQIQSKLWLCKELEKFVKPNSEVAILGSWYNVLAFMLLTRNYSLYNHILGVDSDPDTKLIADKITEAWTIEDDRVTNIVDDAGNIDLSSFDLIINCSPEHMKENDWYNNIRYGTLVCIQSSDVDIKDDDVWKCINPNKSLTELTKKYPLSKYLYSGERIFDYGNGNGYKRFMIIGIK